MGWDPNLFGMHSIGADGGATAAANAGIPDRQFKRYGQWKSETVKDGYVEDSLESTMCMKVWGYEALKSLFVVVV